MTAVTKTLPVVVIAAVLACLPALADPLAQPKPHGPGGSCPHGYFNSGSFCVRTRGAQDAIPKPPNATCPWGWTSSGSFCLRSGRSTVDPWFNWWSSMTR
jgi:hypothetical protein